MEAAAMGHSTSSMTERVRQERAYFDGFQRALLLKKDKLLFDELWNVIEAYIPAAEKSSHPLLIATILLSMILELRKQIDALQCKLEMLQHESKLGHQSQADELAKMKDEIQGLDKDVDSRLRNLRAEIDEMLYPTYAS
jgi:hypothetical protein